MTEEIELTTFSYTETPLSNYEQLPGSSFRPQAPRPVQISITAFKNTAFHAMTRYLYTHEVAHITNDFKRTTIDEDSVLSDFFAGDINYHQIMKDHHYQVALDYVRSAFAPPEKYRPVHLLDIEHHYPLAGKPNAERPFSTDPIYLRQLNSVEYRTRHNLPENPKTSVANMKSIIFDWSRLWLHEIKEGTVTFDAHLYSMLLHSKTALVDEKDPNKMRTIYGTPKPFVLAEIMFYWPLVAHYKRNPGISPLLWGYETITGGWFRLNAELMSSYTRASILMIDYSRFDKYAYFQVFDDLDQIFMSFINFDQGYMPTKDYPNTASDWTPRKAQRLRRLFRWTCYAFRQTPIVLPDGRVYRRLFAGVPSGLYTTQLRDSAYNVVMIVSTLSALDTPFIALKVQGDDSLTKLAVVLPPSDHALFLQRFHNTCKRRFNSNVSTDKSKIKNGPHQCEVLGYANHHGLPFRDPNTLLAQWYHTKDSNPTIPRAMASCIGYAYALCGASKRHYHVLRDCYEYYASLGYSPDMSSIHGILSTERIFPFHVPPSFPSKEEITRYLMKYSYEPSQAMSSFWNDDWFLERF